MTNHKIITGNSRDLSFIPDNSVELIVTAPPSPMVPMWDEMFIQQDEGIREAFEKEQPWQAYAKMHDILDEVWQQCDLKLTKGGLACIIIQDVARDRGKEFALYPNHARLIESFMKNGYSVLPGIFVKKKENGHRKFLGSGLLPTGAYIPMEHDYILIFRKGEPRSFKDDMERRRKSAIFYEERSLWFKDVWDVDGTFDGKDYSPENKACSSFFFEIPYRLVNMYSLVGDTVLDPFCGLGTTNLACMASGRSSIGVEADSHIAEAALQRMDGTEEHLRQIIANRIGCHRMFVDTLPKSKKAECSRNIPHDMLVKTNQEIYIDLPIIGKVTRNGSEVVCV